MERAGPAWRRTLCQRSSRSARASSSCPRSCAAHTHVTCAGDDHLQPTTYLSQQKTLSFEQTLARTTREPDKLSVRQWPRWLRERQNIDALLNHLLDLRSDVEEPGGCDLMIADDEEVRVRATEFSCCRDGEDEVERIRSGQH